jgi:ribosomal protein S18 acetylase RimI-like enzyme
LRCLIITIEPITPENALVFKAVRLRALEDSPSAFGSTYARESQFPDEEWVRRAGNWNGIRSVLYLAMEEGESCGLAGVYLDEQDPGRAHLVSMWIAPAHRRKGVAKVLVRAVQSWAKDRKAHTMLLQVTSSNQAAIRFYHQLGFSLTGRTEPYPNDSNLIELEMSQPLTNSELSG